jgi:hypothetical protein
MSDPTYIYAIHDYMDSPEGVRLYYLPVTRYVDTTKDLPDSPSRMVPPHEAYVIFPGNKEESRVVMGVDAAYDLEAAIRLAVMKIERYVASYFSDMMFAAIFIGKDLATDIHDIKINKSAQFEDRLVYTAAAMRTLINDVIRIKEAQGGSHYKESV